MLRTSRAARSIVRRRSRAPQRCFVPVERHDYHVRPWRPHKPDGRGDLILATSQGQFRKSVRRLREEQLTLCARNVKVDARKGLEGPFLVVPGDGKNAVENVSEPCDG